MVFEGTPKEKPPFWGGPPTRRTSHPYYQKKQTFQLFCPLIVSIGLLTVRPTATTRPSDPLADCLKRLKESLEVGRLLPRQFPLRCLAVPQLPPPALRHRVTSVSRAFPEGALIGLVQRAPCFGAPRLLEALHNFGSGLRILQTWPKQIERRHTHAAIVFGLKTQHFSRLLQRRAIPACFCEAYIYIYIHAYVGGLRFFEHVRH